MQARSDSLDHRGASPRRAWSLPFGLLQALVYAAALASAAPSAAQARRPWLEVDADDDPCIAPDDLGAEVDRLLDGDHPPQVRVRVGARGRGWTLELWHATGERALRELPELPDDCAERLQAVALATALAVEHAVGASLQPPDPGSELPKKAAEATTTTWLLGVHGGASLGELSSAAPVLGLHASATRGVWVPIELRAFADLRPSQAALAGDGQLSTRQLTAALDSCLGGGKAAWRVDGCLGVEMGGVLGRGDGLTRSARDTAGSGALNLGAVARWFPRPQLALTLRIEGFARFWVPRFQVLDAEGDPLAARRLPPAGGRLWIGLAWRSQ